MTWISDIYHAWAPPPNLKVSEWAERYRQVPIGTSPYPGSWSNKRFPPMVEIMDAVSDPSTRAVVVACAAQLLKTEFILNTLGRYIHVDPCSMLLVRPSAEDAEDFSKERVQAMIDSTPELSALVAKASTRSGSTILQKSFPHGFLALSGSNSPTQLSSRAIRLLLCDEIDRWKLAIGNDGDPLSQAEKRSTVFEDSKVVMVSTPTTESGSRIWSRLGQTDMRLCELPCPRCGEYINLVMAGLRWEKESDGSPIYESAHYVCQKCEGRIEETEKPAMLEAYRFRPTKKGAPGEVGFWGISSLYSPWPGATWPNLVKKWYAAQGSPEQLQAFTNLEEGLPYKEIAEEMAQTDLAASAEDFSLIKPRSDTLALFGGMDVQKGRVELTIIGVNYSQAMQVYKHIVFEGDTSCEPKAVEGNPYRDASLWLSRECGDKFLHGFIDCNYLTAYVHRNRIAHLPNFTSTRGVSGPNNPLIGSISTKGFHGYPFRNIAADQLKDILHIRLQQSLGEAIVFSDSLPTEYFDGLTAEKLFTTRSRGVEIRVWKKVKPRNEPLDTTCMAWGAFLASGVDLDLLERERLVEAGEGAPAHSAVAPVRKRRRGGFLHGWK